MSIFANWNAEEIRRAVEADPAAQARCRAGDLEFAVETVPEAPADSWCLLDKRTGRFVHSSGVTGRVVGNVALCDPVDVVARGPEEPKP